MSFGSSSNGRFRQGDEWSEATSSFDNAAFNDIAENIATTVHHGSRAIVARQLYQPFYANRDGNERPELNLTVEAWGPNLRFAGAAIMRTVRVTAPAGVAVLYLFGIVAGENPAERVERRAVDALEAVPVAVSA